MKIRVGIVGYGNLGKAVEQTILADQKLKLVAIFSRRLVKSRYNTKVEQYDQILDYKSKIDIMLLCGSSKTDLEYQTPELLKHFDVINTFDTHAKITKFYKTTNNISTSFNHRAIICCGWDPGIFSVIRGLLLSIGKNKPITFWGKGISMGHSDAVRNVHHVDDGIEFTVPIKSAVQKAKHFELEKGEPLHERICFVCANDKHQKQIERDIKSIPNYFKGQPTKINFISREKVMKLKQKMYHKGLIIQSFKTCSGSNCKLEFSLSIKSNPDFTACVMVTYLKAIINLKKEKKVGAFTPLDIPISYLFDSNKKLSLLSSIC